MSGKQKECGYSWTSEGEIHTCNLPEGHTGAHICGFVFNPADCCLERAEPTPPEGEADPLSPLLDMSVVEGLSEELRKAKAKGEAVPEQEGDFHSGGCNDKCSPPYGHYYPAAPVVSTAAPEPSKRDRAIPRTVSLVTCANCDAQVPPAAAGCIRCGASLMIKNSASENPVAPESYKPAEGQRDQSKRAWPCPKCALKNNPACGHTYHTDPDPAATPVTVEAPHGMVDQASIICMKLRDCADIPVHRRLTIVDQVLKLIPLAATPKPTHNLKRRKEDTDGKRKDCNV